MIRDPPLGDGFNNLIDELGRKGKDRGLLAKSVKNSRKGKVLRGPDRIIIPASSLQKGSGSPGMKAVTSRKMKNKRIPKIKPIESNNCTADDLSSVDGNGRGEIEAIKSPRKKSRKSKKKKTLESDCFNGGMGILSDFQSMKSMNKFVLANSPYKDPLGDPLGNSGKTVKKFGKGRSKNGNSLYTRTQSPGKDQVM